MSKLEWVKWYPEKFLNGISGMTIEQIGVYALVLNLIYDNGGPIKDDRAKIARRGGMRPTSLDKVLASLQEDGKLTISEGLISNPKAEEELETRTKVVEKWKKNLTAANPKLIENVNDYNVTPLPIGEPRDQSKSGVEKDSVEKKERKKDSRPAKKQDTGVYSEAFEALWLLYPRTKNTSKKDAWNIYRMLSAENQERVGRAVPVYAAAMRAEGRADDKIKHMTSWLNSRMYETAVAPVGIIVPGAAPAEPFYKTATREQWAKILTMWSATNDWRAVWGPNPDHPECFVPPDMIAAHNVKHRGFMFSNEQLDDFRKVAQAVQ